MAQGTVYVEGLRPFLRDLRKVDKDASKRVRDELKGGAGAAFVADVRGKLGWSQSLPPTIKAYATAKGLEVRTSPPVRPGKIVPKGMAAVYEFGARKLATGRQPRRAFMYPTADEWQRSGRVERELEGWLEWVEREVGR